MFFNCKRPTKVIQPPTTSLTHRQFFSLTVLLLRQMWSCTFRHQDLFCLQKLFLCPLSDPVFLHVMRMCLLSTLLFWCRPFCNLRLSIRSVGRCSCPFEVGTVVTSCSYFLFFDWSVFGALVHWRCSTVWATRDLRRQCFQAKCLVVVHEEVPALGDWLVRKIFLYFAKIAAKLDHLFNISNLLLLSPDLVKRILIWLCRHAFTTTEFRGTSGKCWSSWRFQSFPRATTQCLLGAHGIKIFITIVCLFIFIIFVFIFILFVLALMFTITTFLVLLLPGTPFVLSL